MVVLVKFDEMDERFGGRFVDGEYGWIWEG